MKIVLMRSALETNDPYVDSLTAIGNVSSIPVLSFIFCNHDHLKHAINQPELWSGVVFTSKRSVEAVQQCLEHEQPELWAHKPCYVVGESTEKLATDLGFQCKGSASGNAQILAELIVQDCAEHQLPLLFVCGQLKREALPTVLTSNGISYQTIIAYDTVQNPLVNAAIESYVKLEGTPNFIVFFSPSGYRFCYSLWRKVLKSDISAAKIVCIGGTTAEAFSKESGITVLTANKPNPAEVYKVIQSHCN